MAQSEKTAVGRIIKGLGGLYDVMDENGTIYKCKARGIFRLEKTKPLVGDIATLKFENDTPFIYEINERKNTLIRPPMANLDILFCTVSAAKPAPSTIVLDKLISIAAHNKIEPVIVITKSDIDEKMADYLYGMYKKSGYFTFKTSVVNKTGLDEIEKYIRDNSDSVCAFSGASGVGKSTLMNAIFPFLQLETGDVSRKTERGRHTTRSVELFPLSRLFGNESMKGFLADTPGFAALDFERFDFYTKEELPFTFREFEDYIGKCRYTKCSHTKEEGCAIIEAVKRGDIYEERHKNFVEIYNDLKNKHEWDKKQ